MSAAPEHVGEIIYTIFPNTSASKKYELAEPWGEIVTRIKSPKVAAEKSALPLISFGVYGDARTDKGALRHQGNLRGITGIEGDYDGEVMPMEDAAERLGLAGIKSVFYTSPSHTPEKPRWRILAPLSKEYPPADRPRFVARINGILGGILTGESFTTSQSFYIGRVEGRDCEVIEVDGDCIDTRPEFDQHAVYAPGRVTHDGRAVQDGGQRDPTPDEALRAAFRAGKDRYQAMMKLSARWAARGLAEDDIIAALTALLDESPSNVNADGVDLRSRIAPLARSAVAKFGESRAADLIRTANKVAPDDHPDQDDDRFPPIDVIAADETPDGVPHEEHDEPGDAGQDDAEPDEPLFQTADTLRASAFDVPAPIIEGVLLPGATLVHGPAKKGKSWLLLQMALAIDAGENFLGRPVSRRDCLYVGAEDTSARFKSRLERMFARGTLKFMNRKALTVFAKRLRRAVTGPVTAQKAVEALWTLAGKPSVIVIDTQEVFEVICGIAHGKPGDSITRRDYQATSSYDGTANHLGIAVVLVGHWGEIKSIEKATINPHECLNTTKARLAGVTTSITLGPLPNQEPGEATHEMQLSIRSRDLAGGDQFLWLSQDRDTGVYQCLGTVRDVLVTEAQARLFTVLMDTRKERGGDTWLTAAEIAEELDCSTQAVKQMVARVKKAAKAKGRKVVYQAFELESKPSKGYRLK